MSAAAAATAAGALISLFETFVVNVGLIIHFCSNTKKVTKVEIDQFQQESDFDDSDIVFYRNSILDIGANEELQSSLEEKFKDTNIVRIEPLKKYLLSVSPSTYVQFLRNVIETVSNWEGFVQQHSYMRLFYLPFRHEFKGILDALSDSLPPMADLKNIISYNRLLYELMYKKTLSKESDDFVFKCRTCPGYNLFTLFGTPIAAYLEAEIYPQEHDLMNMNHAQFIAYVYVQITLCNGDISEFFGTLYRCIFRFEYEDIEEEIRQVKSMNIGKQYYKRKALIEVLYKLVTTNNALFQLISPEKLSSYSLVVKKFEELFPSKKGSKEGDCKATLERYGVMQSFAQDLVKIMFPHLSSEHESVLKICDEVLYRTSDFTVIGALKVPKKINGKSCDDIHNDILYTCILYKSIFQYQEEEMKSCYMKDKIFGKIFEYVLSLFQGVHRPVIKYWSTIEHEKISFYFPILSPGLNWIDKDYRCETTFRRCNPYECLREINEFLLEIIKNCRVHSLPAFLDRSIPRDFYEINTYYLPKINVEFTGRFVVSCKPTSGTNISTYYYDTKYSVLHNSIDTFNANIEIIKELVEKINCCH